MRTFLLLTAVTFLLGALPAFGEPKTGAAGASEVKNPSLAQMLAFALQDEWAARAEYQAVLTKWPDAKPFVNIIKAEESHIGWLMPLFKAHNVAVPVSTAAAVITPKDWTAALAIGAEAEVANIAMYDSFLKQKLPDDVRAVFLELKKGSENHLRAFRK